MNYPSLYNGQITGSTHAILSIQKTPLMQSKLTDTLRMYRSVERLGEKTLNTALLSMEFREAFAEFKIKIEEIQENLKQEEALSNLAITNHLELRAKICRAGSDITILLFQSSKTTVSIPKLELFYNEFYSMKTSVLDEKMQEIHDEALKSVSQLKKYGITPSLLEAFQTMLDSHFRPTNLKQLAALKKRNFKNLRTLFRDTDIFLKDKLDKSVNRLKKTNPQFVYAYKERRIVE